MSARPPFPIVRARSLLGLLVSLPLLATPGLRAAPTTSGLTKASPDIGAVRRAPEPQWVRRVAPQPATHPRSAWPAGPRLLTTLSHSGQFVVTGPETGVLAPLTTRNPADTWRDLTPQTLAPSCERVKAEILDILDRRDLWRTGGEGRGKIFVNIEPGRTTNTPPAVAATPFEGGWQFRVYLPPRLPEDSLVRALTQAVLLEFASRRSSDRPGEPPLWLVEGLTQKILAESPGGVAFQPQTRIVTEVQLGERLRRAREELSRRPPLSFQQLSQPDIDGMQPRDWRHYGACAFLFLREIRRLPDGTAQVAHWLESLSQYWNWQTGFLDAFNPPFHSLLDVEKWWSLVLANFTGRSIVQTWSADFSLKKLGEILQPVGVLPGPGQRATRLDLAEVIADWDFARQTPVLNRLLQQLNAIRINAPGEISALAARYADVVDEYLENRRRAGFAPVGRGQPTPTIRLLARQAVASLRELDGERDRLAQTTANPPPASEPGPNPGPPP